MINQKNIIAELKHKSVESKETVLLLLDFLLWVLNGFVLSSHRYNWAQDDFIEIVTVFGLDFFSLFFAVLLSYLAQNIIFDLGLMGFDLWKFLYFGLS